MDSVENRVVVTGLGVVCAIGCTVGAIKGAIQEGRIGFKEIDPARLDLSDAVFKVKHSCIIDQESYEKFKSVDESILIEMATIAISEALQDAGIDVTQMKDTKRLSLCLGTSIGGGHAFIDWMMASEKGEYPYHKLDYNHGYLVNNLARRFRVGGAVSVVDTACASGTNAIGRGYDLIQSDRADIVITGGLDVFHLLSFCGFNSVFALSKSPCRPFDKERKGLNLGDGAGILILERKGSRIEQKLYATVSGYAILNEAYHATAPHPQGKYALLCMETAIKNAKIDKSTVNYINTHGTSTSANDKMEITAIENLFRNQPIYVNSSKSMIGHCLGGAGAVEAVITVVSINDGCIHPNVNLSEGINQQKNIILPKEKQAVQIDTAISNSFAFAGNMSSIIFEKINGHGTYKK